MEKTGLFYCVNIVKVRKHDLCTVHIWKLNCTDGLESIDSVMSCKRFSRPSKFLSSFDPGYRNRGAVSSGPVSALSFPIRNASCNTAGGEAEAGTQPNVPLYSLLSA